MGQAHVAEFLRVLASALRRNHVWMETMAWLNLVRHPKPTITCYFNETWRWVRRQQTRSFEPRTATKPETETR